MMSLNELLGIKCETLKALLNAHKSVLKAYKERLASWLVNEGRYLEKGHSLWMYRSGFALLIRMCERRLLNSWL